MSSMPLSEITANLNENGYVLIPDVLDKQRDLRPVEEEYANLLDTVATNLYSQGYIGSLYDDLPFGERFLSVAKEAPESIMEDFDIIMFNISTPLRMHTGQAVLDLIRSPRLLDLLEVVLGGEIYSNPLQYTRLKLPSSLGMAHPSGCDCRQCSKPVPWHQDLSALLPEADRTMLVTVWIPMTDSTVENGCLQYLPGSHLGGLTVHYPGQGIPDWWLDASAAKAVPARPGDVILHTPLTKHRSLPNRTDKMRWSFDLRYQKTGEPTGRPFHPGFVARSRSDPNSELTDSVAWRALWENARGNLRGRSYSMNRWSGMQGPPVAM